MKSIHNVSRFVLLCATLSTAALCPRQANAAAYASAVTNISGTVHFILNENANSVIVNFDHGASSINLGALAQGANAFTLGVHTNYSIVVSENGAGVWNQISVDTTNNSFNGPRGIAVNRNPNDFYFGRVYVINASPGTGSPAPAQTVGKGLYILNADTSDALGRYSTASTGGATFGASTTYGPYRCFVGPDDQVYVADSTGLPLDANGTASVWMFDPNINTGTPILKWGLSSTNFGGCQGTPIAFGSTFNNTLQLYCYMWDYATNGNYNIVYGYNVGGTLPYTGVPSTNAYVGASGIGTVNEVTGDIYPAPDGKLYAVQYRGSATGGNISMMVFSNDYTTYLWDSSTASGGNDPFVLAYGVSVSPDDQYVAAIQAASGNVILAKLTNGIPDISTCSTNVAVGGGTARGIAFDAADNVYVTSGGNDRVRAFSIGFSSTATTYNDLTGTNGTFSLVIPPTTVSVVAITNMASQTGPAPGVFQISRAGQNLNDSLTVSFTLAGTAGSGLYTCSPAGINPDTTNVIVLAPGQTTTNITITPVNDGVSRPTTTVLLSVQGGPGYSVAPPSSDTVYIANTGPQLVLVSSVVAPSMYNSFSNDYASFVVTRWGDTNAASYTVNAYTGTGTAISGVDYTTPQPITFNPGDVSYTNYISPLMNGQLPVASTTNVYVGNKTAIVGVGNGSGYTAGTNTVALTIIDAATPPATVLYSDPLTDQNDATNWGVTSANCNMQTNAIDNTIAFGYDLQNGDPGDYGPIPLPPNGAATALRVTVNKDSSYGQGAAAAVNLYPTNVSFSGNYAVRFDMNVIEGYNPNYTTEGILFGINHSGEATNWWAGSALLSGWGPHNSEVWESDGVWYWVSVDGLSGFGDYTELTGVGGKLPNSGWQILEQQSNTPFYNNFKTNDFTGTGGPGLVANGSYFNGYSAYNWANVEIRQYNGVVTLSIDKIPVTVYTNATAFTNGTVMLGYEDPYSSVGTLDSAVYYSNLRVVSISSGLPVITETALNNANGTVVINFTTTDGETNTSAVAVQSATLVAGPYTTVANATITSLGGGAFQAVVPQNGAIQFYRVVENQ